MVFVRKQARASTDIADSPNFFSVAGLDVEKKDGEGTPIKYRLFGV